MCLRVGLYAQQEAEMGSILVIEDCEGDMVDVHDRGRRVVLEPEDTWRSMDAETSAEEAAHIAR